MQTSTGTHAHTLTQARHQNALGRPRKGAGPHLFPADWRRARGTHGARRVTDSRNDLRRRTLPTQSPTHTQLTKVLVDLAKQYREKELELQKVQQELGG